MTNPPPLYDTLYPLVVDYLRERGYLSAGTIDQEAGTALTILDHLLDGEDGLGYRIYLHGVDEGRYGHFEEDD